MKEDSFVYDFFYKNIIKREQQYYCAECNTIWIDSDDSFVLYKNNLRVSKTVFNHFNNNHEEFATLAAMNLEKWRHFYPMKSEVVEDDKLG